MLFLKMTTRNAKNRSGKNIIAINITAINSSLGTSAGFSYRE